MLGAKCWIGIVSSARVTIAIMCPDSATASILRASPRFTERSSAEWSRSSLDLASISQRILYCTVLQRSGSTRRGVSSAELYKDAFAESTDPRQGCSWDSAEMRSPASNRHARLPREATTRAGYCTVQERRVIVVCRCTTVVPKI